LKEVAMLSRPLSLIILFALVLFSAADIYADSVAPPHFCKKPYKPPQFTSQSEVDEFKAGLKLYKECIDRFIAAQKEAVDAHHEAAKAAADEFNKFVSQAK
jgi:hypothetical protein